MGVEVAALNPAFAISRARAAYTAGSDDSTFLAQLEPITKGLRKAGVPPRSALRHRERSTNRSILGSK